MKYLKFWKFKTIKSGKMIKLECIKVRIVLFLFAVIIAVGCWSLVYLVNFK